MITKIQNLLSQVEQIYKHHQEMEYISGDRFNIFKIIERTREEEGIHSRFIAELLNPNGSHGQGTKFLALFLRKLQGQPQLDLDTATVKIEHCIGRKKKEEEQYTEHSVAGDIDIYIFDQRGVKIAIENKIDAADQPYQLRRYYNYTKQPIYYLNLDAHPVRDTSSAYGMTLDSDYYIISYNLEIIEWLEECRKEAINHPLLREGLLHYINLVKQLTNQPTNKAMETEIYKTLLHSPATLQSAYQININFNKAKQRLQKNFWMALVKAIGTEGLKIKNEDEFTESALGDTVWSYYNKKGSVKPIEILLHQHNGVSFHWLAEINDNFFTGFTIEINGEGAISNAPDHRHYREILMNQYPEYRDDSANFIGWKYSYPVLNFREFNSDAIFSLADDDTLKQVVSDIAKEAKSHIDFAKSKFQIR